MIIADLRRAFSVQELPAGSRQDVRARLVTFLCSLFSVWTPNVCAEEVHLCIRARSLELGRELLQTRQLKFQVEIPESSSNLLLLLASRASRQKLWPDLQPEQVVAVPFDPSLCGNEPTAQVTIRVSNEELAAVTLESYRGAGRQPKLDAIAARATGKQAPPKVAPTGAPARARRHEWLQLHFATTRHDTGDSSAAKAFGATRSDAIHYGKVAVSIPADHRWANLESPSVLRLEWDVDPERHVALGDPLQRLSHFDWTREIAARAGGFNKAVLLFVHGYNNSFAQAAGRAAQLAYDLAFPGPTVLFSWPSDGDLLPYTRDEEKARTAWRQMTQVLDDLTKLGPGIRVYVVAHSMGNRVFTEGMAELLRRRPGADQMFAQVILASPDVGTEEFRQRWIYELNSANAPRYTMYASNQDVPVAFSAWLHGEPRLGSGGRAIAVLPRLDSVDASTVTKEWFGLSHSYFGDNDTVMSDLFLLVHEGLEPSRRPRLRKVVGDRGEYWEFRH